VRKADEEPARTATMENFMVFSFDEYEYCKWQVEGDYRGSE
jgi:hypothetical protein